jgi:hypothetical protein
MRASSSKHQSKTAGRGSTRPAPFNLSSTFNCIALEFSCAIPRLYPTEKWELNMKLSGTILVLGALGAGLLVCSAALASDMACGKPMTAEQKAQKAIDVQAVQNVMGYHQIYGAPGGSHDKEIELIWAQKTPNMSFAENEGIYTGDVNVIKRMYGDSAGSWMGNGAGPAQKGGSSAAAGGPPGGAPGAAAGGPQGGPPGGGGAQSGNFSMRTLTTPIIEIAGDGKTAKAFWYTIGWTSSAQGDKGQAQWSFERYGIDFVKEDDDWKIWHFHVYNDFDTPYEKNWVQNAIDTQRKGGVTTARPGLEQYFKPTVFHHSYDPKVNNNPADPPPPVPYCHFEDTFSY